MAVMNQDAANMLARYGVDTTKYGVAPQVPVASMPSQTSESANASQVSGVDALYDINRQFAVDQAQKQMDYQTSANKIAMDFSAAEAEKQRVYSTEMANTAYQRAVQDLRKAGLNPALAYQQGGAAVPSVSAASGVTSPGAMATLADTGYKKYELEQEMEIEKAKIAQAYVQTFVNAATQVATRGLSGGSKTGKIGF